MLDILLVISYFVMLISHEKEHWELRIMSSMPSIVNSRLITGEELLKMKDIELCELVAGRLVPMSPTGGEHGFIELQIAYHLKNFVSTNKIGWVLTGEVGIYTRRNPDSVRGADVVFISKKRLPQKPQKGFLQVAPELVVEILSPPEPLQEIQQKIKEYLDIGVKWIWIVHPNQRTITIYQPANKRQTFTEMESVIGEDILTGLEIEISALFEE